jgi:hypothetical protein
MQVQNKNSIRGLLRLAQSQGYKIYDRPYELNIVGIRSATTIPNKFDDKIAVFYKTDKGVWEGKIFNATTDPGTYWLNQPMNPQGTAILQGNKQYVNSWKLGMHQGKYKALVQAKPVPVMRDYDRNALLDFNNGKIDVGMHGINMHRANETGTTKSVDKYSAGCQVFENAEDFAKFLTMAEKHAGLYGNQFTYTLIDERAYLRALKRRGTYVVAGLVIATAIYVAYRLYTNKPIIPKF